METETTAAAGLASHADSAGGASEPAKSKPLKPSLEHCIAKQARGEKLTMQERGVLGGSKRKAKIKIMAPKPSENLLLEVEQPAAPAAQAPSQPAAAVSDNPLLEASPLAVAAAAAPVDTAYSSEACKLAAEAILDGLDNGTQMWVGYECDKAGFPKPLTEKYESAVALQSRNRKLMVEGSEPVVRLLCKIFKCAPEKLPDIVRQSQFAAGAFAHAMAVIAAVRSIRESAAEKQQQPAQPAA